ncbi:MAG: 2OG-Fe(II) oxygenase [Candidimonas sp.]|nr:MAG: 2OG-Fe(II) oxygenase [Candidimonas sp.]
MDEYDEIIQALDRRGWAISDTAVPLSWHITLLLQSWTLWQTGRFSQGEIGRDASIAPQPEIRGDSICWVEPGSSPAAHPFFKWMTGLRQVLNERYQMGLRSQEFHFARYGEGKGYRKHVDQHRGTDYRKISIVLYLNLRWNPMDGGELCLYEPFDPDVELRRIVPLGARLVVFVSGRTPHAVLPCRRTRWSLAGWLRTDERRSGTA